MKVRRKRLQAELEKEIEKRILALAERETEKSRLLNALKNKFPATDVDRVYNLLLNDGKIEETQASLGLG